MVKYGRFSDAEAQFCWVIIFQKAVESGIVKDAKIFPSYKSKHKYLLDNYRPSSLLLALAKYLGKK